jgi:hypothetical protein
MPAVRKYAVRVLHPKAAAILATATVYAEHAAGAYAQCMRILTENQRSAGFWELEEFPQ